MIVNDDFWYIEKIKSKLSPLRKKVKIDGWLIGATKHRETSHLLLKVIVERRIRHVSGIRIVARIGIHHSVWIEEILLLLTHHIWILLTHHRVVLISRGIGRVSALHLLFSVDLDLFGANWAYNFNWIVLSIPATGFSQDNSFFLRRTIEHLG